MDCNSLTKSWTVAKQVCVVVRSELDIKSLRDSREEEEEIDCFTNILVPHKKSCGIDFSTS